MPRPTGLLKEIVPGENDDNLRRLLSSPASGRTRGRTQSLATQASDSPSNSPPSTNLPQSTFADSPTRLGRAATKSTPTKSNGKDQTHPSSSRAPPTPAPKSVAESAIADSSANPAGSMSSQRSRLGRNNARGGSPQENIAQQIWSDFYRNHFMGVKESEIRTKQVADKIVELEKRVQRDKEAGNSKSKHIP